MIPLLLAALLPITARAQTIRGPVGAIGEGVPAPLAGVADPQAENLAFSMLTSYEALPDEQISIRIGELRGLLAWGTEPQRAAARAVLWAVSGDHESYLQGVSLGIQHALIEASRRTRVLRVQVPGLHVVLEEAGREAEAVEAAPAAITKVEPAQPPAAPRKPKIEKLKWRTFTEGGGWMEEMDGRERSIAVLADRDSELAAHFDEDTDLGWRTNQKLANALSSVEPKTARPLVAATHLHEAASRLDEPRKAKLMFRFMEASLHPDLERPVEERRLTAKAVEALYSQLGWGSTPLEQAIRRHLDARVAEIPPADTSLAIRHTPSALVPMAFPSDSQVLRLLGVVLTGMIAFGGVALGSVPVIVAGLLGFIAIAWRAIGDEPAEKADHPDPEVAAAMKELDAEFPPHPEEHVQARFRVLLDSNPSAAELEAEEEEQLREKLRRLDEGQGK